MPVSPRNTAGCCDAEETNSQEARRSRRVFKGNSVPCLRGELLRCGGVAFWQLNEPWPTVSRAVIPRGPAQGRV